MTAGIEAEAGPGAASVRLAEARDVALLPGFAEGVVSAISDFVKVN